ncbi:MAG: peptidylprolyl isomerase [Pseudomonadota bacterium]
MTTQQDNSSYSDDEIDMKIAHRQPRDFRIISDLKNLFRRQSAKDFVDIPDDEDDTLARTVDATHPEFCVDSEVNTDPATQSAAQTISNGKSIGSSGSDLIVAHRPLTALGRSLWQVISALGSLVLTVWRLAGALDSALWQGLVLVIASIVYVIRSAAQFLYLNAVDLVRWLPTSAGKAYISGSAVAAIIAGLWIIDEMTNAAQEAGEIATVITPPTGGADPVVARVGGRFIRLSEIVEFGKATGELGSDDRLSVQAAFEAGLVEAYAEQRLLSQAAIAAGVSRDDKVSRKLAIARDRILAAAYLENRIAAATEPQLLKRLYNSQADLVRLGDEVRARHIVVATEVEAQQLRDALVAGADFSALAKANSLDRSTAPGGGEIGYFTRQMMTPVLANAAFTTSVGDFAPLFFSPFGWHVLQVMDRRPAPSVRYGQVEDTIRDFVTEQTIAREIDALARKDEITYFKPIPARARLVDESDNDIKNIEPPSLISPTQADYQGFERPFILNDMQFDEDAFEPSDVDAKSDTNGDANNVDSATNPSVLDGRLKKDNSSL